MLYAVAVLAMLGIALRPRGIPAWAWAVTGAVLVVVLGYETTAAAAAAFARQWNVLLFFLGLMGLSIAAEEGGAFEWLAARLCAGAGGSRRRLFVWLFLGGAVLTVALSNDATAIVFTPIVYRTVAAYGADALPFLFGCTFVADTASFGLPFSNPANVLVLPRPSFAAYAWHMIPPQLAAIAINLGLFLWLFRGQLHGSYSPPAAPQRSRKTVRTLTAVASVVIAYVVALCWGWPLGPVAVGGAAAVAAVVPIAPLNVLRRVSWGTFALLGGLFVIFDALARGGLVAWLTHALEAAGGHPGLAAVAAAATGAALLSNAFNNLPVAVAASTAVAHGAKSLAFPLIVGADLGPNLTIVGSFATILWLSALHRRGVHISALQYLRLGAFVVPPMLVPAIMWFWLVG